jgi:zinc transporter 1/2/3
MDQPCNITNTTIDFSTYYNLNEHILVLFIIFCLSGSGVIGTILLEQLKQISKKNLKNKKTKSTITFQMFKFFGIGVIAATAWIHILPDAFSKFSDPCLKDTFWDAYGTNWVGLFGLIASFVIQLVEFLVISKNDKNQKKIKMKQMDKDEKSEEIDIDSDHFVLDEKELLEVKDFGTLSLEMGILFHSLVIGMALGVSTTEFLSLAIAVSFHQTFEGIALGVRIGELVKVKALWKKIGLGLAYPLITPIGVAIGIVTKIRTGSYDTPNSLLLQGILNSLSGGILIYNTYVELIAMEMNMSKSFRSQGGKLKFSCFLLMYSGAAVMAVIAIWA